MAKICTKCDGTGDENHALALLMGQERTYQKRCEACGGCGRADGVNLNISPDHKGAKAEIAELTNLVSDRSPRFSVHTENVLQGGFYSTPHEAVDAWNKDSIWGVFYMFDIAVDYLEHGVSPHSAQLAHWKETIDRIRERLQHD